MTGEPFLAACFTALIAVAARAVTFTQDARCPTPRLLISAGLSLMASVAVFELDVRLGVALVFVLAQTLVPLATERSNARLDWRIALLPLAAVDALLPAEFVPHVWQPWLVAWRWLKTGPVASGLLAQVEPRFVVVHASGLLLCLADCNLILRKLLDLLKVHPPTATVGPVDPATYLRGGLVGAIERLLIYIFAANGAFNAIAFVITAKGIVRYQEIMQHHSAEYVLVGTLLSTLMAMVLGMLFVHLA
jgi:hypothetical protein